MYCHNPQELFHYPCNNENDSFLHNSLLKVRNLVKFWPIKTFWILSQEQSLLKVLMVYFINFFLQDVELQSQKLIPIFKLPHLKINWYSTNICTCLHCNWFLTFYGHFQHALSTFGSDHCLFRWKQFIFRSFNNLQHLCFWTNEYKRPY